MYISGYIGSQSKPIGITFSIKSDGSYNVTFGNNGEFYNENNVTRSSDINNNNLLLAGVKVIQPSGDNLNETSSNGKLLELNLQTASVLKEIYIKFLGKN